MAAPTPDQLRTEFATGPIAVEIAPLLANAQDQAVADLYNDLDGPHAGPIAWAWMERDKFLARIASLVFGLGSLDPSTQVGWRELLAIVRTVEWVSGELAGQILGKAQLDGLATAEQAQAILTRQGSLAEVRWGSDTVLTSDLVAQAR